jgi:hypothetical protein
MLVWDEQKREYVDLNDSLSQYPEQSPVTLSKPFQDPKEQSAYTEKLKAMSVKQPVEQVTESVSTEPSAKESGSMAGAAGVQKAMAAGGSGEDALASGLTGAGMATMNPYLVGAGLGLTAMSSISKGKNARAAQEYESEVQKYQQRQSAIQRMAELGRGLKA